MNAKKQMPWSELIVWGMLLLHWTSSKVLVLSLADYRSVWTSVELSVSGNHVGDEQAASTWSMAVLSRQLGICSKTPW